MKNLSRILLTLAPVLGMLTFTPPTTAQQQSYKPDDVLKPDSKITVGKLPNGLTYYIRPNRKPEKRAELRLVVKAGSVLEDDDQQGLAHFVEHMAFNGTKSFPKQELVSFMEKIGMRLGPDVNAYTSFDETVYILQVPTDTLQYMQKAFQILEEWAHAVTFDEKEIDKERGVVIEEWRLGKGAFERIQNKHNPVLFYKSQYAVRLPIGKKEILESSKYETLRRFYRDWYRPELMAVVAVGDFDRTAVETLVKQHFTNLTNPSSPRTRTKYTLPDHSETLASIATDAELPIGQLNVVFKRALEDERTTRGYRNSLLAAVYDGMLNARLQERVQQANPPFTFSFSGDSRFVGQKQAYFLGAGIKENAILPGLDAVVTEAYRVKQHGFTSTELERQKKEKLRFIENAYNEREKTESSNYASEFIRNFLVDEPIPGIEAEFELYKLFVPGMTLDEVNKLAAIRLTTGNRIITVSAPKKEGVIVPTEAEVIALLNSASTKQTEPYVDKVSSQPLLATLPKPGMVVSEKTIASLGVTEWKLSNGALVVLKPTDFKNDEILFSAYSKGGTSLASDKDYVSASMASAITTQSGVGDFDLVALQKLLTGKVVRVSPTLSELSEGFAGSATPQDLETLFQLVHLYFKAPRKDTVAFASFLSRQKAFLQNRGAFPDIAFFDSLQVTLSNYHYRARPLTAQLLDELSLDKAYAFYKDRFADPSDFIFFFVGNFQLDKIKPLVTQYLASLPSINRSESWRDVGMRPPKGVVKKQVYKGIEPKSRVQFVFTGPFEWSYQNRYNMLALIEVLRIKLREVLREDKGGVYGVQISGAPSLYPRKEYNISIGFGCAPERVDELIAATMQQIDSLRLKKPEDIYIEKTKEIQRREREVNLKENQFWLSIFRQYYANGENPEEILQYVILVDKLSGDPVQQAAKQYFDANNMVTVVLYPEKK
jgi:zinc protease